jgi:hypothetical protein
VQITKPSRCAGRVEERLRIITCLGLYTRYPYAYLPERVALDAEHQLHVAGDKCSIPPTELALGVTRG